MLRGCVHSGRYAGAQRRSDPPVQTVKGIKITDGDTKKEALRRLRAEQAMAIASKMEL